MKWPQSYFENIIWITFFSFFPFWHGFQRVWSHSKFDSFVFLFVFTEEDGERCCSLSVLCSSFSHLYESKPQARVTRAQMVEHASPPRKHSSPYKFLSKHCLGLWSACPLWSLQKEEVLRWPCVERYPGPEQETCSEESYGNFTSSVVRREVFCARETSVTFTMCSQTSQGKMVEKRKLHFLWFPPNMLNSVQSEF